MITFDKMVREATHYLEGSQKCGKHHVEHTGSLCYLLDFYDYLGEVEKAKLCIEHLLTLIVDTPGGKVFYPGHMNPMNMSQNVIDTGAATDAIARFLHRRRDAFTESEHERYRKILGEVAETYLRSAAAEKVITNQRLWGLTGLASYARYAKTREYDDIIRKSVERAFTDMTPDGFFLYFPHAATNGNFEGYEGITTFYQSRCTTFIRYSLEAAGVATAPYEGRLRASEAALLAMYRADGTKDLRLECKRWYWQSPYEVASAGFDAYALAHASIPEARTALHNLLYQVRRHFYNGYLHSHIGAPINFQCPIFWTAHLAWALRVENIQALFDSTSTLRDFSFRFEGKEVFTDTTPTRRILVNARFQKRNPNEGIYENGLESKPVWRAKIPALPPAFLFSVREVVNHAWYALRGGYLREAALRLWRFTRECIVMLLPRYDIAYGKITSLEYGKGRDIPEAKVIPATKYGSLGDKEVSFSVKV